MYSVACESSKATKLVVPEIKRSLFGRNQEFPGVGRGKSSRIAPISYKKCFLGFLIYFHAKLFFLQRNFLIAVSTNTNF